MFVERIGCFLVEKRRILEHQGPPLDIVKACSSIAWSHGLKLFAVRNGSECLGDEHFPFMYRLNTSKGCHGGRGGQNVSDVYRLTSKNYLSWQHLFLGPSSIPYYSHPYTRYPSIHTSLPRRYVNYSFNLCLNREFICSFFRSLLTLFFYCSPISLRAVCLFQWFVFVLFCCCFACVSTKWYQRP